MLDTLTIRPGTPADVAAVDALLARSYPVQLKADYAPSVMVTAVPIISRARPELVSCGTYYLAETQEGAILGAGGWTHRSGRPGCADIRHVVTDHRHTRKGIGRALFQRIFEECRSAGIDLLDCMATRTAVPFYQAMGFQVQGPVNIPLAQAIPFPAIQMQRRL